jgi:hypothetical protein
LAIFDQYCATCSNPRWQQWCNIKLAKRLVIANIIFWTSQGILYLVLYELIQSPTTNQIAGTSTNLIFAQYRAYVTILFFLGLLLMTVPTVFGLLAYGNVQQLNFRTLPLIRNPNAISFVFNVIFVYDVFFCFML